MCLHRAICSEKILGLVPSLVPTRVYRVYEGRVVAVELIWIDTNDGAYRDRCQRFSATQDYTEWNAPYCSCIRAISEVYWPTLTPS